LSEFRYIEKNHVKNWAKAHNFPFIVAAESEHMSRLDADGVLGLGISYFEGIEENQIIQSMKDSHAIKKAIFSIYMSQDENIKQSEFF